MTIATPPPSEKGHPSLLQQLPSKRWGPVNPPSFLKIWLEAQLPPPSLGGKGGVHTMCYIPKSTYKNVLVLPSWHLVHPAAENDFDTLKQLVGFANELYVFNHFVGLALKGLSLEVTKIT